MEKYNVNSMQLVTPAKKCIYDCPFCISKGHKHDNKFVNNYEKNFQLWRENLKEILRNNNSIKVVVITGSNEPMQDQKCINDMIDIVRNVRNDIKIEIQTRNYNDENVLKRFDIVAYSISKYDLLEKVKLINENNRYTIILTDSFKEKRLKDILDKISDKVQQVTFKVLQYTDDKESEVNTWIKNHKLSENDLNRLLNDIKNYKGNKSIRFDENCMNANDRYVIYREDGNVYSDWSATESI